jgi:cytochrome c biogenesis protein CcdA
MSAAFAADLLALLENSVEQNISMPACPMAAACKRMTERKGMSMWMIIPGVIFIALGVAIILYPKILAWLAATALIVMGLAMLMMFNFMRDFGKRIYDKPA